jgi:uncharacterized SAM-binding protein YcdF (DUF218 family)
LRWGIIATYRYTDLKKITKAVFLSVVVCLILAAIGLLAFVIIGNIHLPLAQADAIVVLGSAQAQLASERALEGLRLYGQGKAPVILLTGGQTQLPTTEAAYMEDVIRKASSMPPRLLLENKSRSTIENLINTRRLLPEAKIIIIVSNNYHIVRSCLIAKRVGFEKVEWSAPKESRIPLKDLVRYYYTDLKKLYYTIPYLTGR